MQQVCVSWRFYRKIFFYLFQCAAGLCSFLGVLENNSNNNKNVFLPSPACSRSVFFPRGSRKQKIFSYFFLCVAGLRSFLEVLGKNLFSYLFQFLDAASLLASKPAMTTNPHNTSQLQWIFCLPLPYLKEL